MTVTIITASAKHPQKNFLILIMLFSLHWLHQSGRNMCFTLLAANVVIALYIYIDLECRLLLG